MASSSDPAALHRVILHLDLDAFYAQVEHKRLNIPREVPLAVQQWQGIIAVNYPARAAGIKVGSVDELVAKLKEAGAV